MKILHIINNLGSGGAERLIEETMPLINKIEDVTAEVLILTDKNLVFHKKLIENNIKLDVISIRKPRNPLNTVYIRNYIIKGKYDIVHAHLFPTNYWVSIASRLIIKKKPKFVTTEHSTYNNRRYKVFFRLIEKYIYSSYHTIISISNKTQSNLISWLKPKKKHLNKFNIIENGVDTDRFFNTFPYKKFEIHNTLNEHNKLICMVGRFDHSKDQPTLIKAMKGLPKYVHLLLVGEGPLKKQNENLAIELNIDDRVHFLGFRSDVDRIIKTSDIVVLSSNWEGFGLAAVEGMASGKPIITSNVEGVVDIVKGYGLLFYKGDVKKLKEEIMTLLLDKDYYDDISKKCLARAQKYSIQRMIDGLIQIYYEIKNYKKV